MQNRKGSPSLTLEDAIFVWHRSWDGDYQHQIAAKLGCNQGRISEILNKQKFPNSEYKAKNIPFG